MRNVRRAAGVTLGILAGALVSHMAVSACTVFTSFGINSVSGAPSGPAGSQVAVHGAAFQQAPVDVYWGSVSGPLLATVPSVNFSSAMVTIPANAAPGFYYIVATDHTGPVASISDHFTVTAAAATPAPTPAPSAVPTPVPTSAPTGSASSGQPVGSFAPAPVHGLVGATVNRATTDNNVAAAPAAATGKPAVSSPAIRSRAGTPSAAPRLGKPLNRATGSLGGPPTPLVMGLVFAGLSVLGAAAFTAFLIPRRRSARAAQSVDTSFDGGEGG